MKTNFNSKRRNNVQKTSLNVIAVIISLVILSVNVDAQGMWQSFQEMKNADDNEMLLANDARSLSSENEAGLTETNTYSAYEEQETEATLNLEDWMTNASFFTVNAMNTETEDALELEDWMVNENYFSQSAFQFETETENALELEDWMVNENYFQAPKNGDEPLALENWMVADKYWAN